MRLAAHPAGYHRISRRDDLFRVRGLDDYKQEATQPEPAVCTRCGAVFHGGHWQWRQAPENAHASLCSACHRIQDHTPAGFLTLEGDFCHSHLEEILSLVRNHEKHEQTEHPMQRIIAIEKYIGTAKVTTTDIHLARGFGELLHHTYQGTLKFHYNPEQSRLRVQWKR